MTTATRPQPAIPLEAPGPEPPLVALTGDLASGLQVASRLHREGWWVVDLLAPIDAGLARLDPWIPLGPASWPSGCCPTVELEALGRKAAPEGDVAAFCWLRYRELRAEVPFATAWANREVRRLAERLDSTSHVGRVGAAMASVDAGASRPFCQPVLVVGLHTTDELSRLRRRRAVVVWAADPTTPVLTEELGPSDADICVSAEPGELDHRVLEVAVRPLLAAASA